jgi:hypothetical protein
MRMSIAVRSTSVAICLVVGLPFAVLSARRATAQGFAAVAVSPSTLYNGVE